MSLSASSSSTPVVVNEAAMEAVIKGMGGFEQSTKLKETYMRNNKSGGVKHLRCFPHCAEQGHVPHGFCGSPLFGDLIFKDKKTAGYSYGCVCRFLPLPKFYRNPAEACASVPVFQPKMGGVYPYAFVRRLVATRKTPALPLYESAVATEHWDGENSHALFKFEPSSWNYAWRSNKHRSNVGHACRMYVFQFVNADGSPLKRDLLTLPGASRTGGRGAKSGSAMKVSSNSDPQKPGAAATTKADFLEASSSSDNISSDPSTGSTSAAEVNSDGGSDKGARDSNGNSSKHSDRKSNSVSMGGHYVSSQNFINNLGDDAHIMFICTSDSNSFTVSGCKPENAEELTAAHAITNADRLNRSRFIVALDNEAITLPDDGNLPSRFRTRGLEMTGEVYFGNGMMLSSDSSSSSSSGGDNNNSNTNSSSGGSSSDNSRNRNSDSSGDSSDSNNHIVGSGSDSDADMGKSSNDSSRPPSSTSLSSPSSSSSSSSSPSSSSSSEGVRLSVGAVAAASAAAARSGGDVRLPLTKGRSVRRSTSSIDSNGLPKSLSTGSESKSSCVHGRRRYTCKMCGGKGICRHNRQRYQCKDCGGGGICKHDRIRSQCKICGGGSICQHKRIRSVCKDCGGGSICEHKKIRSKCKECRRAKHQRKALAAAASESSSAKSDIGSSSSTGFSSALSVGSAGESDVLQDGRRVSHYLDKAIAQFNETGKRMEVGAAIAKIVGTDAVSASPGPILASASQKKSRAPAAAKKTKKATVARGKGKASRTSTTSAASKGVKNQANQSKFSPLQTVSAFKTPDISRAVQKKHLQLRVLTQCESFYVRNNKRGGLKNLRCFPKCLEKGHNKNGFCGRSLNVELRITSREFRKSQFVAYGRFITADPTGQDLDNIITPYKTYQAIDIMNLTKTKTDNTKPLYKSNPSTDYACKSGGAIIFRFNPTSWHYGWRSSKHMKDSAHVFRIFCFVVSSDRMLLKCIGVSETSWFTLASSKRSKTKNAPAVAAGIVQAPVGSILDPGASGGSASGDKVLFSDTNLAMLAKLSRPSEVIRKSSSIVPVQVSSIMSIGDGDGNSMRSLQQQQMAAHRQWDANPLRLNSSGAYASSLNMSSASRQESIDDPIGLQQLAHQKQIRDLERLQVQMQKRISMQGQSLAALSQELNSESARRQHSAGSQQTQAQTGNKSSNNDSGGDNAIPGRTSAVASNGGVVSESNATGVAFVPPIDSSSAKLAENELEVQAQLQMLQAQIQQSQLRLLHAVKLNQYQEMVRSRQRREQQSLSIEEDADGSNAAVGSKRRAEDKYAQNSRPQKARKTRGKTRTRKSDPSV